MAVIVVNYRTPDLTKRCLAALRRERDLLPKLRAIIVDGGSGDGSADELAKAIAHSDYADWVSFLPLPINGGFGWANNEAISRLMREPQPPQFIHLLNPDTEIEKGAVAVLRQYLCRCPRAAAVGSQLLELDGSLTGSAFSFPTLRGEFARAARTGLLDRLLQVPPVSISASSPTEVDWATGASVMFRTEALQQVGLFDEGFFLYHEEIELMWRLRQGGWIIAFEPRSRVPHVGGAATGVHSRETPTRLAPRRPPYWYRSRARFFALSRGWTVAALAYFLWLVGYPIWCARRSLGLARRGKAVDHQLRDHLLLAFPRLADARPAIRRWDAELSTRPAWMREAPE